ncbi:MAG: methyl-accepting chemotaxis protein [Bacillota bacterium]|uniref:Methyl-accepting chemotaxis protein n=1 Tax=[Clostridium] aminophilum TaxID=1526 RepID=A0A1I6IYW7_9FIRM|nr:methyl-accepting chemotaxis protein [[Clostridium] aminophilum]MDT3843852.1 methyl-accepting chemotaxis protein [Bacillota bacterium]SFR71907.1 methyl-accepting chemotaxis protein [[Clostridium] aminophilum]
MNKSSSNSTNRSGSFRMSIRTKILMLGLSVAIIPLSLSAVVSSVKSRQTGRDNAIATVQNLTSSISSEVSEYINKSYAVVQSLSVSGDMLGMDPVQQDKIVKATAKNNPYFSLVYQVDSTGMQTARSSGEPADRSDRWWYKQIREQKNPFVSKSYVSATDGAATTSIFFPEFDEAGEMTGIIGADLSLSKVQEVVSSYDTEGTYSLVIDGEGICIAHPDSDYVTYAYNYTDGTKLKSAGDTAREAFNETDDMKKLVADLMNGGSGVREFANRQGEAAIYSYRPIAIPGSSEQWGVVTIQKESAAYASVNEMIRFFVIFTIVMGVLSAVLAILIANRITRPLKKLAGAAQEIADGNLKVEISAETNDETGDVASAMHETASMLSSYIDYINEITEVLNKISIGDLTFDLQYDYAGNFAAIKDALFNIRTTMTDTMSHIRQVAEEVNGNAATLSSGAQSLAQGTTEQASSIEELSATIADISNHVKVTAENAEDAEHLSDEARVEIQKGNEHMQEMVRAMQDISDSSKEIGKIIKTIEDIAFQTNILALNAAVEAARAGAAGKGFAVVADEVGNLAKKSAEAASNTTQLIEKAVQAVEHGIRVADETARSLDSIVDGSEKTAKLVQEIAEASGRQADSIAQVTVGIDQVSSVVQTNSATAEESAATSQDLSEKASRLHELVGKFKLN